MEIWRHVATDSLYLVLGEATCSTNGSRDGKEKSVFYYSIKYQRWFYREASEFYDGRFVKEEVPEWKGKKPSFPFEPMSSERWDRLMDKMNLEKPDPLVTCWDCMEKVEECKCTLARG